MADQETTVKTGYGTTDWLKIEKGVCQGFNLYAEYIMQNAELDESQTDIKTAGRNTDNLRYADDTTLMAESEEELKSFLMKVKEEHEPFSLESPSHLPPYFPTLGRHRAPSLSSHWLSIEQIPTGYLFYI